MNNKHLLKKMWDLKDQMCEYIAKMIGDSTVKLDWTFQSVSVSMDTEGYGIEVCHISELFVDEGVLYIKIDDTQYPDQIESTPLRDESMDVVYEVCELVERIYPDFIASINEVQRTIISRSLLADNGYDPDQVSDERLEQIAGEILEYLGISEYFSRALEFAMSV